MLPVLHAFLERIVRKGMLEVETGSASRFTVGDGSGKRIAVWLADSAAARQLVLCPQLALGELYMDGRLVVTQGSIYDLIVLFACNLWSRSTSEIVRAYNGLRIALRPLHQRNTARRAKCNVAHHYDLDGRLYRLFLDSDMQYSCAYFEHLGQRLEEAQLAKKRHIAAKLLIEPGDRILDIGSGWGGLALYLAECCGARVTGITLSKAQLEYARSRAKESGLAPAVDFRALDYRAIGGTFDRIVSVGMFEHVGVGYFDAFFTKIAELLADDGIMLLHSIGRSDGPSATNSWIAKYIFPGGFVPALSEVLPAVERAGLIVTDIEILRLHYAETLKAWRERFLVRRHEAKAVYDERFCRMWEFYLAIAECGFRHGGLMVFQMQLAKRLETVPLTRDYITAREAQLRTMDMRQVGASIAAE
ncbi:cyclopropane-fatty-acyl-phospholipid synthase family protein [Methyloceanibacter sp.]|uniref:cyclopropane-fatty-acyl-phospholipid synthase family protein n=1 Tax=Methyloceanibacter sp. TaxID=1965321 RepID=UPI002D3C83EC|nr:cyclopropane-fatty-acyl-phospholipid synthase family protein [Methyloceanibacter sp.]HZP08285.1 cyclopropane-fatty-acyl-phospholipid synthase family protein [Methyloceanibacter sp.]